MNIKSFVRDSATMTTITVVLLVLVNFIFVYLSPSLIPVLPSDFVRGISPCYRTFYHTDISGDTDDTRYEIVFGDSFSEGSGDEYLSGDGDYGIFRKLDNDVDRQFLIFGRSGYGNMGMRIEEERCWPLLTRFTGFSPADDSIERLTVVFYEGNDLQNNLIEMNRQTAGFSYQLMFFLPLFHYSYKKLLQLASPETRGLADSGVRVDSASTDNGPDPDPPYPVTDNGIQLGLYPQPAPVELTPGELNDALGVLRESIKIISQKFQNQQLQVLYLPSVASSYGFAGELPVQSYKDREFFMTSGSANRSSSLGIRGKIREFSDQLGWQFCDSTESLVNESDSGAVLHGPVDWKHFNKQGYETIKLQYLRCFSDAG